MRSESDVTYVDKVCAYITRGRDELLVFDGPGHDDLQVPKGTIETDEVPRAALEREVEEESGLSTLRSIRHVTSDVWTRRHRPPKRYNRHFFHATVDDDRDGWTHLVTGDGEERGSTFEYSWIDLRSSREFALALDDYLHLVERSASPV
ncbi:NUDIX domain-containing protein [Halosolutus amylolyticus]|uniref:NUDIX domain-containing protein n=1 Tax=Halosolutus amylolyticus TaxID=2932267 RepID=A0ABD5PN92_9EURY|nr:NUDIX domain-containing protein [Halosolutus amylolyticus]